MGLETEDVRRALAAAALDSLASLHARETAVALARLIIGSLVLSLLLFTALSSVFRSGLVLGAIAFLSMVHAEVWLYSRRTRQLRWLEHELEMQRESLP